MTLGIGYQWSPFTLATISQSEAWGEGRVGAGGLLEPTQAHYCTITGATGLKSHQRRGENPNSTFKSDSMTTQSKCIIVKILGKPVRELRSHYQGGIPYFKARLV